MPIPNVHFDDHPNDVAMRARAYRQGKTIYEAAGAKRTILTPPYPSTHNLGTARMAATARDGGRSQWGPTLDLPNLFLPDGPVVPTGGSGKPTPTIVTPPVPPPA